MKGNGKKVIVTGGSVGVTVRFDTGTKTVSADDIRDAIGKAVAKVTGATDVSVWNNGMVLIGKAVAS